MRIPADSSEARELREAAAEAERVRVALDLAAERQRQDLEHAHATRCRRGWLGEDGDGRPVPCLVCRPHLAESDCRACGTSPASCHHLTATRRTRCCTECAHEKIQPASEELGQMSLRLSPPEPSQSPGSITRTAPMSTPEAKESQIR